MARKTMHPAHQARSRESLKRLLRATIAVLDEDGLEGATIPRIAARAGLSPGTVYRRFPDKDALMREVCLRVYEENYRNVKEFFSAEKWKDKSLAEIARSVIELSLKGHRTHRGLLRSLTFFILQHPDAAFVRKSEELQAKAFQEISELLLTRRHEIRHPDPESAVRFAILTIPVMADGVLVLPPNPDDFNRLVPDVEATLHDELPRMFLRFLGIEA
jgi:AcrR family transcriptional regulator